MVRFSQLKIRAEKTLSHAERKALLRSRLAKKLRLPENGFRSFAVSGEAIDARRKPEIYWVMSVDAAIDAGDEKLLFLAKKAGLPAARLEMPESIWSSAERLRTAAGSHASVCGNAMAKLKDGAARPVVAGFGPCGMFAALTLAEFGMRPIVLERGYAMEERVAAVERFWRDGVLDPACNVQFGEGGAGTFSDGKLTTGTRDAANRWVLEALVRAGADPDILYRQKPHVGTDVLRRVVVSIRNRIEELGGEIRFGAKLESLKIRNGRLCGCYVAERRASGMENSGSCNDADGTGCCETRIYLDTDALILALGHSARDTVRTLYGQGLLMEQKPFSMGVRIEHRQTDIDLAQYGSPAERLGLPPADYKLSVRTADGRGVYTFCMCPGGYVVASASEEGGLVTNGMSNRDRAGENANSGLLCDVRPEDLGSDHPLAGMDFQRKYEALAFALGGGTYRAPAQRVGDFLSAEVADAQSVADDDAGRDPDAAANAGASPSYRPGVTWAKIDRCLPDFVAGALREALPMMDRKLKGFADPEAVLTAIESRSSSPVRIKRAASGEALAADGTVVKGLYPGGEGAGYAGGIVSAAADGIRLAQRILEAK